MYLIELKTTDLRRDLLGHSQEVATSNKKVQEPLSLHLYYTIIKDKVDTKL